MWQNIETWLVLASLGISVVALVAWIRDAGDDWLKPETAWDRTPTREAQRPEPSRQQQRASA